MREVVVRICQPYGVPYYWVRIRRGEQWTSVAGHGQSVTFLQAR
jgi:hypothetical protein